MFHFHQAVHQLIYQVQCTPDEVLRCSVPVSAPPSFLLPDWLECQSLFPKFFWQDRQRQEEVVALGHCRVFDDPAQAYPVLVSGQRVWGGRSFDGGTEKASHCPACFFFLPLVELSCEKGNWVLTANWSDDKAHAIAALEQLVTEVPAPEPLKTGVESVRHTPDEPQWYALLEKALDEISDGMFDKVVLARESVYRLKHPVSGAQLLKASRETNHQSFHFLLAIDENFCFTGATPERLYFRDGQLLETEALAGTTARGTTPAGDQSLADWLIHDDKNLQENQYVVDDIIDHLAPLSLTIDTDKQAKLVKLSRVQHLKRRIHARLKPEVNGVHLLGSLQPTAAVAGYPREEAQAFIAREEPFPRGWYAGAMGYISHEKAEFCVAIRSALIAGVQVKLYAGAGIVPGSVAQEEWQELDRKMSTLLSLITDPDSLC